MALKDALENLNTQKSTPRKILSGMLKNSENSELISMDNRKTGLESYVTWADFLSPIGWFVLQDGVG